MQEKDKIKDAFDKVRKAINKAKSINDTPFIPRREIVDVQDCEFWNEGHCDCYEIYGFAHCSKVNNCHFKQLIRCKRSLVGIYIKSNIRQQAYKRMKKENEKLENATFTLAKGLHFQQERADKLEQALAEIETLCIDRCRYGKEVTIQDVLSIINKTKVNNNSDNHESEGK